MEVSVSEFLEYARGMRVEIESELDGRTAYPADCPVRLRDAIRHSLLAPAKRLRPLLVLMSAEACGCDRRAAMPAACAVEMVHTYSLIHDDLPAMDDDDLRRGRPTCHKLFGEALAILAGDALLAQSFELLATGIQPSHVAARCCAELAQAAGATALVGGQADDLEAQFSGNGLQQLEAIHRRKTGAMFLVSLRLGALVAGASDEQLASLDMYGRKLGLAFQIVDDLLDLRGDAQSLGKRTKKDSAHGKLTYPAVLGETESLRRAQELVATAIGSLVPLSERASRLAALARYVLERTQ